MVIASKQDFLRASTNQFNIFAGSAISIMGSIAPSVPTARSAIFDALKAELDGSNLLAARYVADYVTTALGGLTLEERTYLSPKEVVTSLKKLKFEELMRRLSDLSGDPNFLDSIIRAMYSVQPGSFNANHLAIAHLLSAGHCNTVYTTNFDNAIENACQHLGFEPRIILPDSMMFPSAKQLRGVIVKLHGCAKFGQVIANSTVLSPLKFRTGPPGLNAR